MLKPFFRYYGGKQRAAKHYPPPKYGSIVEPFAGAAGYSLLYPDRKVFLFDLNPRIVSTWHFLIHASEADVRAIPDCRNVADLPDIVCQEARWLVGWWMNAGTAEPCKRQSAGRVKLEGLGRRLEFWNRAVVDRITTQQPAIRHWKIVEANYRHLQNGPATWFVDPPYSGPAGSYYTFNAIDYSHLSDWCRSRIGQTIVCENVGATWLPFSVFREIKTMNGRTSAEAIWTVDNVSTL